MDFLNLYFLKRPFILAGLGLSPLTSVLKMYRNNSLDIFKIKYFLVSDLQFPFILRLQPILVKRQRQSFSKVGKKHTNIKSTK